MINTKYVFYFQLFIVLVGAIILTQSERIGSICLLLWGVMGVISFQRSDLTILFLSLSQVLPDIPSIGLNLAGLAVLIWVICRIFNRRKLNFGIVKPLIFFVFPLMLWLVLAGIYRGDIPFYVLELIKGSVFSFITYDSLQNHYVHPHNIVAVICIGCAYVAFSFWFSNQSVNDYIGTIGGNRGFERIESWRGNANVIMVMLCFSLVGAFGLWLQNQGYKNRALYGSDWFFLLFFVFCVPALIATQSRTPYFIIPIMIGFTFVAELIFSKRKANLLVVLRKLLMFSLLIVISLYLTLPSWISRIESLINYQSSSENLLSGRSIVWQKGLYALKMEPTFGVGMNQYTNSLTGGSMTSHNTILDGGIMGGVMGIILTTFFMFSPLFFIKRNLFNYDFRLYFMLYFTGLLLSQTIAFQGLKISYILWALLFFSSEVREPFKEKLTSSLKISKSPIFR